MKMPPLNMDETIMLVDAYYSMRKTGNKATKASFYKKLSASLRGLPFYPKLKKNPQFRSESAVEIMMNNMFYTETMREGVWTRLTQKQEAVMSYYADDTGLLHDVSEAISAVSAFISKNQLKFPIIEAPEGFMGGNLLYSFHKYIEEQGEQARQFMDLYKHETVCSVCKRDMKEIYGSNAEKLMSIHYSAPVSWYPLSMDMMSAEYISLCPACHKLSHTEVKLLGEESLIKAFNNK